MISYLCSCSCEWPPEYLYCCPTCMTLSCRDCSKSEINCYYCPSCFLEVLVSSVSGIGTCIRNCLSCPYCFASVELENNEWNCSNCLLSWNLEAQEQESLADINFANLIKHFNCQISLLNEKEFDQEYTSNLASLNTKTRTNLNLEKIRLVSKKIRKCIQCSQILVKPEPKASSTNFLIRYSALDYFPIIKEHDSNHLQIENPTINTMNISFISKSVSYPTISLSGISQLSQVKQDQTSTSTLLEIDPREKSIQVSCTTNKSILNFTILLKISRI